MTLYFVFTYNNCKGQLVRLGCFSIKQQLNPPTYILPSFSAAKHLRRATFLEFPSTRFQVPLNMATKTVTQTVQESTNMELQSSLPSRNNSNLNDQTQDFDLENVRADAIPPSNATIALQKWNSPPENKWRVFATFWSFLVVGMNDGSYGVSHTPQPKTFSQTLIVRDRL